MKATGIVRRIDELGRVVIPKEIRRTLRIREGDPLEIYTDRDGGVILRKYSPIGELSGFAKEYTESLVRALGNTAVICDKDQVISASGTARRELQDKSLSPELERVMQERKTVSMSGQEGKRIPIAADEDAAAYTAQVIAPILVEGEASGRSRC